MQRVSKIKSKAYLHLLRFSNTFLSHLLVIISDVDYDNNDDDDDDDDVIKIFHNLRYFLK